MNFKSQGRPLTDKGMDSICDTLGVSDAEVWAVLSVETRGFGFFQDRRPQILFERHIFHGLTKGKYGNGNGDISSTQPGGYLRGSDEYSRLEKAMELDKEAALQSASWGIGQVMGFNFKVAGFSSVEVMVAGMVNDENTQLMAMANFIKGNNLTEALKRKNWASFARGYNGKDYKKNEYDTRLAAAHAKFKTTLPDLTLRKAQAALLYLGMDPGAIDGLRGRFTRSALIKFQESFGLPINGELDHYTETKLFNEAFFQVSG